MNGFTEPQSMKRKAARKKGSQSAPSGGKKRAQPKGAKKRRSKEAAQGGSKGPSRPSKAKSGGRRSPGSAKPTKKSSLSPAKTAAKPKVSEERLQKVLAAAGLGSRRQCEELILTGRVEVDREVIMKLGTRVDPLKQRIRVDGMELRKPKTVWYALNKPVGVVCTNRDPGGRPRAVDLVPESKERLFPVGRLDMNSEGLLLLTNDGDLANQLAHPRYGITKTYRVLVAGQPTTEVLAQMRRGVYLTEGLTKISGVTIKRRYKKSTILEMVLKEGKNREIRRVLARVGHKVMRLVRIATGPIKLGDLEAGDSRRLTAKEIDALRQQVRGNKT
jgi:23S rRNA pseudouridine2605 synthase